MENETSKMAHIQPTYCLKCNEEITCQSDFWIVLLLCPKCYLVSLKPRGAVGGKEEMRILNSVWFGRIGIVLTEDNITKTRKAYIREVEGTSQKEDELYIAEYGYPFPVEAVEVILYGKGEI